MRSAQRKILPKGWFQGPAGVVQVTRHETGTRGTGVDLVETDEPTLAVGSGLVSAPQTRHGGSDNLVLKAR
jgi:hypothetical protein